MGSDITQQRTDQGWLYVAVVLDGFSHRIVGWSMAEHLRTELVLAALDMALWNRRPDPGLSTILIRAAAHLTSLRAALP